MTAESEWTTGASAEEQLSERVKPMIAAGDLSGVVREIIAEKEREYRRGYRDGWVSGIDALHDQHTKHGLSFERAYGRCWDHWRNPDGLLFQWECESDTRPAFVLPPDLPD